ncbi:MAG TPA: DUF2188 domain-containing protein [Pyrinomonadaceae bacterium]|jgi:hypothetical protein
MSKKSYHVIAKVDGGWSVKRSGAERAARNFPTQEDAIKYGKSISKAHAADLVIHRKDGRLASKVSYSKLSSTGKDS